MKVKMACDFLVTCVLEIEVSLVSYFACCEVKPTEICRIETSREICAIGCILD